MIKQRLSRRAFLQATGAGIGAWALAACGGSEKPEAAQAPSTEKATLKYWAVLSANVAATLQNYNDMSCYKELEKVTGVHLEFQHVPDNPQATEAFNLMIASGQFPDIIETNWLGFSGGPAKALKDGVIISLKDKIDNGTSANLKKLLGDHPEWRRLITTDEGDLYCYPFIRGNPGLQTFSGPTIRQDYLEQVGISAAPTTIEEWSAMFGKFKGQDLNGNGNADEYAFTSSLFGKGITGFNYGNAFIGAWGIGMDYYNEGGKVKYGPLQPEYKEFLKTIVDWKKAGFMHPDTFTMDSKAYDAQMTTGNIASCVLLVGSGIGRITSLVRAKNPNFKLLGAAYPTLKAGGKAAFGQQDSPYPGGGSAAITTACKQVDAAIKVLDYGYGEDGHNLFNFGVKGLSYNLDNGYPKYTDLVMKNPEKLPLAQSMARHFRSNFAGPFVQDIRYLEQYFALPEQKEAYKTWGEAGHDKIMPPVTPTQDESRSYAKIMADVTPRYEEIFAKIVTGAEPIETWDAFVSELDSMGIQKALGIQQAALERFNKRA
ncbi:MAG: hypothetical protein U0350_46040 [Caldilineaceae bacterium]